VAGCAYSATFASVWNGGFVASVTVTNTSGTAWSGWSGGFSMSSAATVQTSWGATLHAANGRVDVTPTDYNASVPSGSSVTLGFQAATTAPVRQIKDFTVNGRTCRLS
jgi:hypothetical protein